MSSLSQKFIDIAHKELGENESTKKQAIQQFQEWVAKQPHIKKFRNDDNFLLRFMRVKKFSFLGATKRFEDFLITVKNHSEYFKAADIEYEPVRGLVDAGYLLSLPGRDKDGSKILMLRPKVFDTNAYKVAHSFGTHIMTIESILNEPETQICGMKFVVDFTDLPMNYLGFFSISEYKTYMNLFQNVVPIRVKGIYFVNLPHFANTILQFLIGLMSEKLRSRVNFVKSVDDLKTYIDPTLLPKEYGGQVPLPEMSKQMVEFLKIHRSAVLESLDCDIDVRGTQNNQSNSCSEMVDSGAIGSFRKLEID